MKKEFTTPVYHMECYLLQLFDLQIKIFNKFIKFNFSLSKNLVLFFFLIQM